MTSDIQTDRFPVDGFCPKFDRNLQIMFKDRIPNFIPVALIVFELSCSQTDIIPKLCFSDSGRSKTWRFVKISSSNFLTVTILSLCILRIRESKKNIFLSRLTAPKTLHYIRPQRGSMYPLCLSNTLSRIQGLTDYTSHSGSKKKGKQYDHPFRSNGVLPRVSCPFLTDNTKSTIWTPSQVTS
ncbi:hypothetical protein AVEN_267842-1 [Araneus ventricosus]|uniref:Uncharacterized protein n=1 Tax=Araneus ventricosus TaxID=182803 RepID=A0A4Y2TB53_ARAVE|nr:hypothetical protein AVEN_267842-1 [Araneus ventricosus]